MKKAYNTPEAELVEFGADVIVTSNGDGYCTYTDRSHADGETGCSTSTGMRNQETCFVAE